MQRRKSFMAAFWIGFGPGVVVGVPSGLLLAADRISTTVFIAAIVIGGGALGLLGNMLAERWDRRRQSESSAHDRSG